MADETTIRVHVQPRASANEVVGWREGALNVRLTAPPVEGAANAACVEFLAKALGIKKSQVRIASGQKSREKRVRIVGMTLAEVEGRLGGTPRGTPSP